MTFVLSASTIEELSFLRKSTETSGSSEKARMPRSSSLAAFFSAALTSSLVVSRSTSITTSTSETFGVGTRTLMPSNLPLSSGSARAPKVFVRQVEQLLVVRVGVDRRHLRGLDAEILVDDFGDGREAVGRAGGVRDDLVRRRVVSRLVDAEDDRDVLALGGRADDDLLDGAAQVLARVLGLREADRWPDDAFTGPLH